MAQKVYLMNNNESCIFVCYKYREQFFFGKLPPHLDHIIMYSTMGGGSIWPNSIFKITPKRLSLRRWNFVSFSSYLMGAFWKIFPINDITASYDDVITKNGGTNFTVKSLLNWKINEILIKSHLSKIWTWNFDRMLFVRWGIHYKRNFFLSDPHCFSVVLKQ